MKTILAALEKKPVTEVVGSEGDRWTLIGRSSDGRLESESRLMVDVGRGLTPVSFDQRQRRAGGRSQWHVAQSSKTRWEQQADVWLPVQHRIATQPSADASSFRKTIQFDIDWTSINEEIPP
ncbi:hypothetical protein [Maioricimonas rarisocia]|uniref:hypothetical protein n=1 Tax=Maioricimonas rarisocia TaxID=2528026 RepID=UPI00119CA5D0|nr:hypothetical protein [Maioricimonas rarisocia]